MPALFTIFDTSIVLDKEYYDFWYKNIHWRLFNGKETTTPSLARLIDLDKLNKGERATGLSLEFISLLSWSFETPTIYLGTTGIGLFQRHTDLRYYSFATREMKPNMKNYSLPESIPVLNNKKEKAIIAIYRESQIAHKALPAYEYLCYYRLFELIHSKNNPLEEMCDFIGPEEFATHGLNTYTERKKWLKDELRNSTVHGSRNSTITTMDKVDHINRLLSINRVIKPRMKKYIEDKFKFNYLNLSMSLATKQLQYVIKD